MLQFTNEKNWILTGHVIFKLRYNQIHQLKTTKGMSCFIWNKKILGLISYL